MDKIAEAVDTLDNLISALSLPIADRVHVESLKAALPEVRDKIKAGYLEAGGEDYWAD